MATQAVALRQPLTYSDDASTINLWITQAEATERATLFVSQLASLTPRSTGVRVCPAVACRIPVQPPGSACTSATPDLAGTVQPISDHLTLGGFARRGTTRREGYDRAANRFGCEGNPQRQLA